jgi:hypothetical protein
MMLSETATGGTAGDSSVRRRRTYLEVKEKANHKK